MSSQQAARRFLVGELSGYPQHVYISCQHGCMGSHGLKAGTKQVHSPLNTRVDLFIATLQRLYLHKIDTVPHISSTRLPTFSGGCISEAHKACYYSLLSPLGDLATQGWSLFLESSVLSHQALVLSKHPLYTPRNSDSQQILTGGIVHATQSEQRELGILLNCLGNEGLDWNFNN